MKVEYAKRMRRKLTTNRIAKTHSAGLSGSKSAASAFDRLNDKADFDTLLSAEMASNKGRYKSQFGFQLDSNSDLEHDVEALSSKQNYEKPRLLNEYV